MGIDSFAEYSASATPARRSIFYVADAQLWAALLLIIRFKRCSKQATKEKYIGTKQDFYNCSAAQRVHTRCLQPDDGIELGAGAANEPCTGGDEPRIRSRDKPSARCGSKPHTYIKRAE